MHKKYIFSFMRAVRAAAFASLALSAAFIFISIFTGAPGEGVWAAMVAFFVAFPACLVVGIPSHFLLKTLGWNRLWHYAILGSLFGIIVVNLLLFPISTFSSEAGALILVETWPIQLLSLCGGFVVGAAFWFLSRQQEPEEKS